MSLCRLFSSFVAFLVCTVLGFSPLTTFAGQPEKKSDGTEAPQKVELFDAMEKGQIDVKLILRDSRGGNVLVTNKTKKPLTIQLPAAFAGVPVLAQRGGAGGGGAGGMGGGGMQGVGGGMGGMGGGMGGMGGGMGGMGGGGGMFNVGPEKVGKIAVTTVCLEHGKTEPSPRVTYEVRRIESFTDKAEVAQLCTMVGSGEVDQNAAQAAAWHLANGLSWDELLHKDRVQHLDGSSEKYFSQAELNLATNVATESVRRGKDHPLPKTSSKTDSQSNK